MAEATLVDLVAGVDGAEEGEVLGVVWAAADVALHRWWRVVTAGTFKLVVARIYRDQRGCNGYDAKMEEISVMDEMR